MNKLLVLLCSVFGAASLSLAQARLDTNTFVFSRVLPASPSQVITIQENWSSTGAPINLYFQSISSTTGTKTEKLVSLKRGNFKAQIKALFYWNGHLNLLTSLYHPGPGRSNFILQQFEGKTLEEKNSKIIDAVATPRPSSGSNYMNYCISRDSNLIGFYSWIYAFSEDSVRVNVQVFNRAMEKQWSKQFTLRCLNNRFFIKDCALRNNGEFFLFAENYTGRIGAATAIKDNLIEHLAVQLRVDRDTARLFRTQLAKGAYFSSIKFGLAADQTLYGIGIWQKPQFAVESGLYTFKLPLGAERPAQNIDEAPKALLQNADRRVRQDALFGTVYSNTSLYNYFIDKVYFQSSGQIYLRASSPNSNMLIRLDDQAKPQAVSVIPRLTYGFFSTPYDGNLFIKGDSTFFLQSQTISSTDEPFILVCIGPNGELTKGKVESRITARRPQFMLNAPYCEQIDDTFIVLTATDKPDSYPSPRTLTFRIEKIHQVFRPE